MKTIFLLVLIGISVNKQMISKLFVDNLKKIAPFDVYEPEENPFRDWTDEEIKALFSLKMPVTVPELEPEIESLSTTDDSYDFRKSHPECILESEAKVYVHHVGNFHPLSAWRKDSALNQEEKSKYLFQSKTLSHATKLTKAAQEELQKQLIITLNTQELFQRNAGLILLAQEMLKTAESFARNPT